MTTRDEAIAWLVRHRPTRELLQWWEHRRTQVYFLSFPKTGRTWLRLMVGKALDEQYQLAMDDPMELGRMPRRGGQIPRMRVSHEDSWSSENMETIKGHYREKTVVFLVRDPRDVVVSMYFQATRRIKLFNGSIKAFLQLSTGSIDSIINYYNIWAENHRVPKRFLLVHYEELHRAPIPALQAVFRTIGVAIDTDVLERAIEFAGFSNMRKLEIAKTVAHNRLQPAQQDDPESFKTRRGIIGGYRNYLDEEDLSFLNAKIKLNLSPFYELYRKEST